jgi:hypothetical protein
MEDPTIGEVTQATEAPKAEAAPNPHADLLAELEKFGVKNAEQLQGRMVASQEAGRLANQLGDARKEISEMRAYMERLASHKPAAQPRDDWGNDQAPQTAGTIDLADLVGKQVKKVIDDEKRMAMQQQQQVLAIANKIQSDRYYDTVKDRWETMVKDPTFLQQVYSGQRDPYIEYKDLVADAMGKGLEKAAQVIKSLTTGAGPPKVHVEGQAKVSGMKTENAPERDKTLNPLREKINKGKVLSEDEELAALMKVLGGGG